MLIAIELSLTKKNAKEIQEQEYETNDQFSFFFKKYKSKTRIDD